MSYMSPLERRGWTEVAGFFDKLLSLTGIPRTQVTQLSTYKTKPVASARMQIVINLRTDVWFRDVRGIRSYTVTRNNPGPKWRPLSSPDMVVVFENGDHSAFIRILQRAKDYAWVRNLADGTLVRNGKIETHEEQPHSETNVSAELS